jgi:hypothetical protein
MSASGPKAAPQANPQYTSLSACQCPLVRILARAWVGVIPRGKVFHRVTLWGQKLTAGAAGGSCPDLAPIRNPIGIRGQIYCVLWKKYGV